MRQNDKQKTTALPDNWQWATIRDVLGDVVAVFRVKNDYGNFRVIDEMIEVLAV